MRFNANGWVLAQQVRKPTGDLKYEVFFDRHDAVGNVEQYRLKNSDGSAYTNTYTLTYARFDGYLEQRNEATSTVLRPGTTTSRYDVNGFLLSVDDSTKPANNRTLINDAAGRVLLRDQAGNVQRQLIVGALLPVADGPVQNSRSGNHCGYKSASVKTENQMNKLLIFVGKDKRFDFPTTIKTIESLQGVTESRTGDLIGAVFECTFVHEGRSTVVRLSKDLETITADGLGDESFRFALLLQALLPGELRVTDMNYAFDVRLADVESVQDLRRLVEAE